MIRNGATGLFQARLISSAWPKTQAGEIRKIRIINADARAEEESALLAPIIVFPEGKLGLYFRLSLVATSRASQIGEHRESFFWLSGSAALLLGQAFSQKRCGPRPNNLKMAREDRQCAVTC